MGGHAYPELENNQGILHIQTGVKNESRKKSNLSLVQKLIYKNGNVLAKKISTTKLEIGDNCQIKTDLVVKTPRLWSVNDFALDIWKGKSFGNVIISSHLSIRQIKMKLARYSILTCKPTMLKNEGFAVKSCLEAIIPLSFSSLLI